MDKCGISFTFSHCHIYLVIKSNAIAAKIHTKKSVFWLNSMPCFHIITFGDFHGNLQRFC